MATKKRTSKKSKAVTKPPELSEADAAYLQDFNARKAAKPPIPKVIVKAGDEGEPGRIQIEMTDYDLGEALMLDSLGSIDSRFMEGLIIQLANVSADKFDFMLSVVTGIEPKDQIEAMLAAQMATVHVQIMAFARRLGLVKTIEQQDSAERAFNKLARTFTAQVEALNRHRGKGQQKVTVKHIHINEGAQAIVGNVSHGGRGAEQKQAATP